ncbi:hypothetical protein H2198_001535 [Neophaeococcomyces mojaviensis]|uniref:Uncharacterized protein n=1 Tax=Neophaeococcomyces mojaviensis TaxID=3383035 RepID=A0ACC3AH94_9EURO|nr:hypothetical protein H2198_001535 [Knufia sp. JES_112]
MALGRGNHAYARYRLQAELCKRREKNPRLAGCYEILTQALTLFREQLIPLDTRFAVTKSSLEDLNLFPCASPNPVFADRASILFCEATLTLWETVNSRWPHTPSPNNDLGLSSVGGWLRNLACFLGDIPLFDFCCTEAGLGGSASDGIRTELPKLLATAAVQGHEVLLQHLLMRMPSPQPTELSLALRGARYGGYLPIANMILQACPVEAVSTICLASLVGQDGSRRLPPGSVAVAEHVVSQFSEIPASTVCMLMWTQAELGATSVVRLLLQRYHRYAPFWPLHHNNPICGHSALWSACINGDLSCVRVLIRDGYFTRSRPDDIRTLCNQCLEAAVEANAFAICHELCQFLGIEIHHLKFCYLARVDGSWDAMSHRLEINPGELDGREPASACTEVTVGRFALLHAARLLRVENVRFLLERGVRLDGRYYDERFEIDWRRKRAYEQKYHDVQALLRIYELAPLRVQL